MELRSRTSGSSSWKYAVPNGSPCASVEAPASAPRMKLSTRWSSSLRRSCGIPKVVDIVSSLSARRTGSYDLPDRTILITGGTGALGSAVVEAFLDAGWRVVVSWVEASELERVPAREGLV